VTTQSRQEIVAVTGATGFVGRHVLAALEGERREVRVLARRSVPGQLPANTKIIQGDLGQDSALRQLVMGADAVLHLAGAISAPDRRGFFLVNDDGTRRLAEQAQQAGVKRVVHMSSLAAREPGLSDYAASKRAAEESLQPHAASMQVAIIRAPAVYGPGDKATLPLIQQLTNRFALIPSSPSSRFSLIYVKDLAEIAVSSLDLGWSGIRDADDGKSGGYGWADLAEAMAVVEGRSIRPVFMPQSAANSVAWLVASGASLAGRSAMVTPGKMRELYHRDWISREHVLRADPPTSLDEGLRRTLAWYRQEGWLPDRRPADRNRLREGDARSL